MAKCKAHKPCPHCMNWFECCDHQQHHEKCARFHRESESPCSKNKIVIEFDCPGTIDSDEADELRRDILDFIEGNEFTYYAKDIQVSLRGKYFKNK